MTNSSRRSVSQSFDSTYEGLKRGVTDERD